MNDEQRRSMLCSLTDEQYSDIMNVLSIYPHIKMDVSYKGIQLSLKKQKNRINPIIYFFYSLVFDDENEHEITAGAVVTLTVHLHRENMSNVFSKEMNGNIIDDEINEEQIDHKETREKVQKYFLFILLLLLLLNK